MIRKTQDPQAPHAMSPRQHVVAGLIDGLTGVVRVVSLGRYSTNLQLRWAIACAKRNWK